MAASMKLKNQLLRLNSLARRHQLLLLQHPQRLSHSSFVEVEEVKGQVLKQQMLASKNELGKNSNNSSNRPNIDSCLWRKVDSREYGIRLGMIPESARLVVRILQNQGHDAYLVGGCVRDLLLNKIPKDFDVITTANLKQIRTQFHRAFIVGRRFPICIVHLKASTVEVSSFDTVANKNGSQNQQQHQPPQLSQPPRGYDHKDLMRWRNSLHRDFTINSLFFDPFAHKIYDYSNAMTDLRAMKLRTLVPAHLSFEEDCARILRGLRLAARLGFSFEKDTDKAIRNLHASIMKLDKARLMMELNYMLSYGAAVSSLLLLRKFKVLDLLLPFQAAYLNQHSSKESPAMLMKLFFNLDKVASCDQPCNTSVWVGLLAFHLALVNNPQDALVVLTFASLLYHGNWKQGVKAARELSMDHVLFKPELCEPSDDTTDEELGQRVTNFAAVVLDSIYSLTDSESLSKAMSHYPSCSASSDLVFISKNAGKDVSGIFHVLVNDIESLQEERHYYSIDYKLLGKGDILEARFVLGKIIMDTMRGGKIYERAMNTMQKQDEFHESNVNVENICSESFTSLGAKNKDMAEEGSGVSQHYQNKTKRPKHSKQTAVLEQKIVKEKLGEIFSCQEITKKRHVLRKTVVKDVQKLLSLRTEATPKNTEVVSGLHIETQASEAISSVLGTKMMNHEAQCPRGILGAFDMVPETSKQHTSHTPEEVPSVVKKAPEMRKLRKEMAAEMVKEIGVSNISKADMNQSKKLCKAKKLQPVGNLEEKEAAGTKRKLSYIFK